MRFFFHEQAEAELDSAVEYYESSRHGLGMEFAQEVYATIDRIIQYPEAWTQMSTNTRRCLVNRFPFGVIYQIWSCPNHCSCRPTTWSGLLDEEGVTGTPYETTPDRSCRSRLSPPPHPRLRRLRHPPPWSVPRVAT